MVKFLYVFLSSVFLVGCFTPEVIVEGEKRAANMLDGGDVQSAYISGAGADIHYVIAVGGSKALLVFIHGTPGDWTAFAPQVNSRELRAEATLIGIDRPGWGLSKFVTDGRDYTLATQSKSIGPILGQLKGRYNANRLFLVGHSLGGSLAPRLAMDFPDDVDGVVVFAGDLTDQYSPAHWYNNLASWKPVSWVLPSALAHANREVMALEPSLKAMRPLWKNLHAPLLVVQGMKDKLVDPRHADFAERLETSSTVTVERIPDSGHLWHLSDVDHANAVILRFLTNNI